jgi:HEAT repeat protein
LTEALKDEDGDVRHAAAQALEGDGGGGALICGNAPFETGDTRVVELLRQLLSDSDETVRDAAAGLLRTLRQRSGE